MSYVKENKKIIISLFVLIITILFIIITANLNNTKTVLAEVEEKIEINNQKLRVDIKGMVATPGVYELEEGSRVIDVINIAGGIVDGANTSLINLSKKLSDEMVIIIYSNEEIENYKNSKIKTEYVYETEYVYIEVDSCPDKVNQACIMEYNDTSNNNNGEINSITDNKININTASIDQLTTLSGIGNSKAQSIIDYRNQNGNFNNIEELSNVTGIGESIIEKIKDNITI